MKAKLILELRKVPVKMAGWGRGPENIGGGKLTLVVLVYSMSKTQLCITLL